MSTAGVGTGVLSEEGLDWGWGGGCSLERRSCVSVISCLSRSICTPDCT